VNEEIEDYRSEEETEGQLSIDVYQNEDSIFILAPIAGVKKEDVDISITDEVLTIKGVRKPGHETPDEHHFTHECYWGPFSRSYVLPIAINPNETKATLKDGLLRITLSKDAKVRTQNVKII